MAAFRAFSSTSKRRRKRTSCKTAAASRTKRRKEVRGGGGGEEKEATTGSCAAKGIGGGGGGAPQAAAAGQQAQDNRFCDCGDSVAKWALAPERRQLCSPGRTIGVRDLICHDSTKAATEEQLASKRAASGNYKLRNCSGSEKCQRRDAYCAASAASGAFRPTQLRADGRRRRWLLLASLLLLAVASAVSVATAAAQMSATPINDISDDDAAEAYGEQPQVLKQTRQAPFLFSRAKMSMQKVTPTPEPVMIIEDECMRDRRWWVFLLSSFLTLVVGIFTVLIYRAFSFLCASPSARTGPPPKLGAAAGLASNLHDPTKPPSLISANQFQLAGAQTATSKFVVVDGRQVLEPPAQFQRPQHYQQQQQQQQQPPNNMYSQQQSAAALQAEQAHQQRYHQVDQQMQVGCMTEAKDWAGELISGQSATGRILVILVFMLSIASLVIYFIDASRIGPNNGQYSEGVEKCQKWSESATQQIDLALNVFFMVYFFIRVSVVPVQH